MQDRSRTIAVGAVVVVLLLAGLAVAVNLSQPATCGGVDRDLGGCDDPPSFTAADCAGVGTEFGRWFNERLEAIITGPAVVGEESRAVRINHAMTATLTFANGYLHEQGIDCPSPAFLAAAEAQFSGTVQQGVGAASADGEPQTYDAWLQDVRDLVVGIVDAPAS